VTSDLYLLQQFGPLLEHKLGDRTVRDFLIAKLLKIRPKRGNVALLKLTRRNRNIRGVAAGGTLC
jgi:hypothetical protein